MAKSLIPKRNKFQMPSKVSMMSFATRRKQVEKAVKEDEYKAGSKVANAAQLEEWFYTVKEKRILPVSLLKKSKKLSQLC